MGELVIEMPEERRIAWYTHQGIEAPARYNDRCDSGIFAICTLCWDELIPEQRLPYYYKLWTKYDRTDTGAYTQRDVDLMWEEIQTKILNPELDIG